MNKYKNSTYPLRIRQDIIDKMKIIAFENSRSLNKEIEQACISYVNNYETKQGEITQDEIDNLYK